MTEKEDAFRISILASGSTGNTMFLETAKKKVLVDAGLSGKKIAALLAQVGRKPEELDAIFVSHEHSDHVQGVGVLARKYGLDVYANIKTWQAMEKSIGKVNNEQKHVFEMGKMITLGDMDIESFGVSHDAAAAQFYRFNRNNHSFVTITDTGYISDQVKGVIKNADAYLFESNHDLEMLRMGGYPWPLKQRILGDRGHLSNEDSALAMAEILGDRTKRIYLGHLSRENNLKAIAHMTMEDTLYQKGLGVNHEFTIHDTDPDEPTPLFSI
jgi:phosphoribosyl 1,2-cyclic phosphodiesterase